MKYVMPKNVGKNAAISYACAWAEQNAKLYLLPIFPGGPMAAIHPVWSNVECWGVPQQAA